MLLSQFAKSYKSVAVNTSTPGQLTLMLFDGALRFMGIAILGFNEPDFVRRNEQIHNNLIKTQNILLELQSSLNMRVEGEFPSLMYALYDFMLNHIRKANLMKEVEPIRDVERLLGEIRTAWAQMLEKSSNNNMAA